MKPFINILFGVLLVVLVGVGQVRGQQIWYETDIIIPGEEYLIGFVVGDDIYLAVNYAIGENNKYYTSYNVNWYGYTARAIFDEENIIGVEGYANDLEYCKFIFYENSENNYTIKSGYEDYYLSTWSSTYYADLHPKSYDTYGKDWKFKNNKLYRKVDNDNRYARYFDLNGTPHMCVTSNENEASQIELYSKNDPLPITLTSFHAVCTGRSSYIYWTTATETNNEYFILEHSTDAINFQEVTRIPGAGTSIEPNDYEYIDYNATGGDNYYRLIQVDYDGTRTPSEIIYANCMDDHLVHYEEPRAYTDNGIVLVAGDRMCDVYVYTILGTQRYTKRMYPGETGRLNYWGHYIVEFVWVDENTYDIKKKVYKLFNIE